MGIILVHDIHHIYYSSYMGRTRPTRRVDISSLRWVLQMKYSSSDWKVTNTIGQSPYEVFGRFPIPIYKTNIGRKFTQQEYDEIDVIIKKEMEPREYKSVSYDKYLLNGKRKSLLDIRSFIEKHLKEYGTTILGIDEKKASCDITQSWLNTFDPQQGHNPMHTHVNSIVSGVLYLSCLPEDGISFSTWPKTHHLFTDIGLPITEPTIFSETEYKVSVVTGDLILFPSSLVHEVALNKSPKQIRVSLAFNTFVFGDVGLYGHDDTSELILKHGKHTHPIQEKNE